MKLFNKSAGIEKCGMPIITNAGNDRNYDLVLHHDNENFCGPADITGISFTKGLMAIIHVFSSDGNHIKDYIINTCQPFTVTMAGDSDDISITY